MNVSNILDLPKEVLERILLFCPIEEQPQYEQVCTFFAEVLSSPTYFPELRLFKDSIVVLELQRQRLKGMTLLSTRTVRWLNLIKDTAKQCKVIALISGIIGVPLNLALWGLWYSPIMIPAYAAISYVSLTAEVACTHLLATNQHTEKEKISLESEFIAQQQFLADYWKQFKAS